MQLTKRLRAEAQCQIRPTDEKKLGFGINFSDHLFKMDYYQEAWRDARIEPYGPMMISPAAMTLHYGQAIFEGLKCYRRQDGSLALFRPHQNWARFNRSANLLCIPQIDEKQVHQGLLELLKTDAQWVPHSPGTSLYIRPFVVATEPHLGVRPSKEYSFMIITSPVGAYYSEGFAPIKIYVEPELSRCAPGGLGEVKAAANYAASLYAAQKAASQGYAQLLWLDPCEHKYIDEVGSMNMFFVIDDEVITSPLSGTILPGITRDSILTIAKSWNLKVSERALSIDELLEASKKGTLQEAFGAGTAAVISPVGSLHYKGQDITVNQGQVGTLTQRFYDEIVGIQYGTRPDPFNWTEVVA